jgi:hypothetical protein
MKRKVPIRFASLLAVATLLAFPTACLADFVSFDELPQFAGAPPDFTDVTPGGKYGPAISVNGVSFIGGVVLNDSGYGLEATTQPNLYATTDYVMLADHSTLLGSITAALMNPASSVSLDIANGNTKADFTLSGYSACATLLAYDTISLNDFAFPGAVGLATISAPGIAFFTVTSGQGKGNIDFAIDTVSASTADVPEPSRIAGLLGLGGMGVIGLAWRRRRSAKLVAKEALSI